MEGTQSSGVALLKPVPTPRPFSEGSAFRWVTAKCLPTSVGAGHSWPQPLPAPLPQRWLLPNTARRRARDVKQTARPLLSSPRPSNPATSVDPKSVSALCPPQSPVPQLASWVDGLLGPLLLPRGPQICRAYCLVSGNSHITYSAQFYSCSRQAAIPGPVTLTLLCALSHRLLYRHGFSLYAACRCRAMGTTESAAGRKRGHRPPWERGAAPSRSAGGGASAVPRRVPKPRPLVCGQKRRTPGNNTRCFSVFG